MAFLITTTGTLSPVAFADLGARGFIHPTTNYDLEFEFSIDEIRESADVFAAISSGYITATYNGKNVPLASDVDEVRSNDNRLYTQNVITVKNNPGAGEFSSVKDAVDSITTATPTSHWLINVGPGLFVEDTITMKPYVHVKGSGKFSTIIQVDVTSKNVIIGSRASSISNCRIQGATDSGFAGIYFSNTSALIVGDNNSFVVEDIAFGNNNILINTVGISPASGIT